MVPSPTVFRLPDSLARWPWPRHLNPHYVEAKAASSAWLESFHAFPPKAQSAFNRCDFNLLASLAYPKSKIEHLRTGCDLMNLFFVFDSYTDFANAKEARKLADIVMDSLRRTYLQRPADENIIGEITRQFWLRAVESANQDAQDVFIETFETLHYFNRDANHLRNVESYLEVRRDTIGAKPSFALLQLDLDLPPGFLADPIVQDMTILAIDLLIIGNDICSYNVEQARGDGHNIVTVAKNSLCLSLDDALTWISNLHDVSAEMFLERYSFLQDDHAVYQSSEAAQEYIDGVGNWVRANDCWSFESERYFGKDGPMVQNSRLVELLPRN
ncbi:terpenoid synthase [Hymenopellis radicata]|nr:terpenoid synthase [Hymenopellis radicata]